MLVTQSCLTHCDPMKSVEQALIWKGTHSHTLVSTYKHQLICDTLKLLQHSSRFELNFQFIMVSSYTPTANNTLSPELALQKGKKKAKRQQKAHHKPCMRLKTAFTPQGEIICGNILRLSRETVTEAVSHFQENISVF